MADPEKVHIVGIGDDGVDGLTATSKQLVAQAELLLGGEELLASVENESAEKVEAGADLDRLVQLIAENPNRRILILATGDPLFYGTARFLCDRLGKDRFEVVPHVSSMQLAFARVKESWDEAYLTNLANQQLERVIERTRTAEKVGMFTTEEVPPRAVARALLDRQIDYFQAFICENLGSPDERVTHAELSDVAEQDFAALNVMILVRNPNAPDRPAAMVGRRLFGNPDDAFLQSKPKRGLLTPSEVRVMAIAELDIGPSSVVWDVGAGSGSVAIEAAQLASHGSVFAIEMDQDDYQLIAANADRFAVTNLTPVLGKAPEVWESLPDPDAVFVGGTGRVVTSIVESAFARLRPGGRIVANVSSLENVTAVFELLRTLCGDANVCMINLARGIQQLERLRFESMNPSFLISAAKSV